MNKHVNEDQGAVAPVRVVAEQPGTVPVRDTSSRDRNCVYVQDDSDYPVDPLDLPDYAPAPGKAATEKRQVEDGSTHDGTH